MIKYICHLIRKYDRTLIWIAIVANLTAAAASIFPFICPRFIIDGIQQQVELATLMKRIFQFAVLT